jgi:predicted nucleic acid-binding protein
MLLVDANIFIELLLGQEKAVECENFLKKISSGELEAVVSNLQFTQSKLRLTIPL